MSTRIVNIPTGKETAMSALPVYHVEFIPLERRLGDRRVAPSDAALPPDVPANRRNTTVTGRRAEDRKAPTLKVV
jgi:hypothetical protein